MEIRQHWSTTGSDVIEILKHNRQIYNPNTTLSTLFLLAVVFLAYWMIAAAFLRFIYFKPDWPIEIYGHVVLLISNSAWFLLVFTQNVLTLNPLICLPLKVVALGHSCGLALGTGLGVYIYTHFFIASVHELPELPVILFIRVFFSALFLWAGWSDLQSSFRRVREERDRKESLRVWEEANAVRRADHLRKHEANVKALAAFQEAGFMEKGGKELSQVSSAQRISLLWGGLDEFPLLSNGLSLKDVRLAAREYAEEGGGIWIDRLALTQRVRVCPFIAERPREYDCLTSLAPPPNNVTVAYLNEQCRVQHLGYDYGCTFQGCARHW